MHAASQQNFLGSVNCSVNLVHSNEQFVIGSVYIGYLNVPTICLESTDQIKHAINDHQICYF